MKGIVISPDMHCEIRDFSAPLYKTIGAAVDGPIELVRPKRLREPLCMLVNEEFLYRDEFVLNPVGSWLYGTFEHGHPIMGTVVIMKTGWTDDGPDIVGLTDEEISGLTHVLVDFAQRWNQAMAKPPEDPEDPAEATAETPSEETP